MSTIDTTNPEELFEESGTLDATYILTGEHSPSPELLAAAMNLSRTLLNKDPVAIAEIIAHFAEHGGITPGAGNAMVDLLNAKIRETTPDQLNDLIIEAKKLNLWSWVKPAVLERNRLLADQVMEYTNLETLNNFLKQVATSSNWIPGDVFDAVSRRLRQLANEADINELDDIMDFVAYGSEWARLRPRVAPIAKKRNAALATQIEDKRRDGGFYLQRGSEKLFIDKAMVAVRKLANGYEFIEERENERITR